MLAKKYKELLEQLCRYDLGRYLVLHKDKDHVYFGTVTYEKNHLVIQDSEMLNGLKPELFQPVWHDGLVGMICASKKHEWESLSYYGLEHCNIKPDLGQTRGNALIAAQNQYGDSIMSFQGSIYRGFNLLLENSFLPVILLSPIKSKEDEYGLIVTDLRTVPIDIKLLIKLNDMVYESIHNVQSFQINSVNLSDDDFHRYFDGFAAEQSK